MSHWTSVADFLAMGGYALFVWGSYGVTAAALGWELLALAQRRRRARADGERWRALHGDDHDPTP